MVVQVPVKLSPVCRPSVQLRRTSLKASAVVRSGYPLSDSQKTLVLAKTLRAFPILYRRLDMAIGVDSMGAGRFLSRAYTLSSDPWQFPRPMSGNRRQYRANDKQRRGHKPSKQRNVSGDYNDQHPNTIRPANYADIQPIAEFGVAPIGEDGDRNGKHCNA